MKLRDKVRITLGEHAGHQGKVVGFASNAFTDLTQVRIDGKDESVWLPTKHLELIPQSTTKRR